MINKELTKTCTRQITPRKTIGYGWKQSTDVNRFLGELLYWVILEQSQCWPFLWLDSLLHVLPILFTEVSGCGSSFRIRSLGSVTACFRYLLEHRRLVRINQLYWETEGEKSCGFQQKPRHKNSKAQLARMNIYRLFSWTHQQLNIYSACPLPAIRQADSRQSRARSSRGQHLFATQGNDPSQLTASWARD